MLRAEDVVPDALRPQLEQPRVEAYLDKARAFLRDQFARRVSGVEDADLDTVVIDARDRNTARGMVADRDQLTALIPVVFWGSHFETDPQHQAGLIKEGILTPEGVWVMDTPPMMLAAQVDAYRNDVRSDLEDMQRPLRAFQVLFGRDDGRDDDDACFDFMGQVFPARLRRMAPDQTRAFVAAARDQAKALDLSGADLVAHVVLSLYFGIGFARDPLHRWAYAPYHDDFPSLEEKRLALGAGLQGFLERFTPDPDDLEPMREGL